MSTFELMNRELEEKLVGEIAGASSFEDPRDTWATVQRIHVTADCFAYADTRAVFEMMAERLREGEPCGLLQMEHAIRKLKLQSATETHSVVGWLLQRQADTMGSLAGVKMWVDELKELSARRRIRGLAVDLQLRAMDPARPVDEALSWLSGQMNGLVSGAAVRVQTLDQKLDAVQRQLNEVGRSGSDGVVLKTGIDVWDRNVGGLWPTLNVIGGHPSRGKSGLAASMIMGLARQGIPGIIFSMEDPAEWLLYRYIASLSRVPGFLMRTRELDGAQQEAVGSVWEEVRAFSKFIMFDERSRLTPAQLVAAARDAILTRGARWVFADHAGEFAYAKQRGGDRPDMDIADGLSDMRSVAKVHGVPFVLLSQLSRSSKPPHSMQDFKNASAIEECARVAAIVWTRDGAPLEPTVSVVKVTGGKREFDMKFQLDATSGLLIEPPSPTMPVGEQKALL